MYSKMIVFKKFQLTHEFWFQENKIVSLCQHLISTVSAMAEPAPQVFEARVCNRDILQRKENDAVACQTRGSWVEK